MTAVRGAAARSSPPGAAGRHGHLWFLDGAGLHAPPGRLVVDEGTGRLCCHLCGEWFAGLGTHVRFHDHTAGTYRAAMRLPPTTVLAARPARRGDRAVYPRAAAAADTHPAGQRTDAGARRDTQQPAMAPDAAAEGNTGEKGDSLREQRSEGWTIIFRACS